MSASAHTEGTCISTMQDVSARSNGRAKEGGVLPSWSIARIALGIYLARTLGEALSGVACSPFGGRQGLKETPAISAQDTELNRYLLSECPAFQQFVASPWAPGAISQTVLGLLVNSGSNDYNRRDIIEAEDGVELVLDWKEQPGLPPDTPILLILHGIGGGSDSRLARCLSDEVRRQGWRAAVYNRRGHGQSSLLPGPLAPAYPGKVRTRTRLTTDVLAKPLSMLKEALPASVAITISAASTAAASAVNKLLTPLSNGVSRSSSPPIISRAAATTTSSSAPGNAVEQAVAEVDTDAAVDASRGSSPCSQSSNAPEMLQQSSGLCIRQQSMQQQHEAAAVHAACQAASMPDQCQLKQCPAAIQHQTGGRQTAGALMSQAQDHGHQDLMHAKVNALAQGAQLKSSAYAMQGQNGCAGGGLNRHSPSFSRQNGDVQLAAFGIKTDASHTTTVVAAAAAAPVDNEAGQQAGFAVASAAATAMDGAAGNKSPRKRSSARSARVEVCTIPKLRRTESLQQVKKIFPRHSDTEDLHEVIDFIHGAYPTAPIVALGFSQGSNVLVHYLGSVQAPNAEPTPLTAALSISNAYDILEGTTHLCRDWVTDAVVTRPIKRLLQKELHAVQQLVEAHGIQVDVQRALSAHSIREFDEALVAPAYGFTSLEDYYASQSCKGYLQGVQVPMLLVNNLDDPIIHPSLTSIAERASQENPWLISVCTKRGGHLGWLQEWRGHAWLLDVMMQYARAAVAAARKGLLQGADTKSPAVRPAPASNASGR